LLKKKRVRSLEMKREKPRVFTCLGQDEGFEECNGLSLRFAEWNKAQVDTDFKFFASTIANFERLAQGDRVKNNAIDTKTTSRSAKTRLQFSLTHLNSLFDVSLRSRAIPYGGPLM